MERAEEALLELRSRRGREQVTYDEVADHLHDFWEQHRDRQALIGDLARYLAESELTPHRHDGRRRIEELIDLGSDESFPASDPPSTSLPNF